MPIQEPTVEARKTIRRFSSHAEQEMESLSFWSAQTSQDKFKAVAEMAESFLHLNEIDIHAQGPKRFVVRSERARG